MREAVVRRPEARRRTLNDFNNVARRCRMFQDRDCRKRGHSPSGRETCRPEGLSPAAPSSVADASDRSSPTSSPAATAKPATGAMRFPSLLALQPGQFKQIPLIAQCFPLSLARLLFETSPDRGQMQLAKVFVQGMLEVCWRAHCVT